MKQPVLYELPALYGILNSNRSGDDLWGKNQFNSTFPISLCCYMRDQGISPIYIAVDEKGSTSARNNALTFDDVFGTVDAGDSIHFAFESVFEPLRHFLYDDLPSIDVVIKDRLDSFRKALEIKLTVVPDSSTVGKPEEEWCSELVVRPVSSAYAALQLCRAMSDQQREVIRGLIEPTASQIQNWDNVAEILAYNKRILDALGRAIPICVELQSPYLIQPIWKTEGKTGVLARQCFDVFVWSDLSVFKLPIDLAAREGRKDATRHVREAARHLRCFYEVLTRGKMTYEHIYGGMSLGKQTDKSFSISGVTTIQYMRHPHLRHPRFDATVLRHLILHGGENKLSPERRFDATVFYTCRELF